MLQKSSRPKEAQHTVAAVKAEVPAFDTGRSRAGIPRTRKPLVILGAALRTVFRIRGGLLCREVDGRLSRCRREGLWELPLKSFSRRSCISALAAGAAFLFFTSRFQR
jgi:hypothetical protein